MVLISNKGNLIWCKDDNIIIGVVNIEEDLFFVVQNDV